MDDATRRGAEGKRSYPPPPWELHGQLQAHLLLLATDRLGDLPEGFRPLSIAGRCLVLAGFIDYQSGSVMEYSELYAAPIGFVAGRRRPTVTVTHMWVDNQVSLEGGRELWGYPKQIAAFQIAGLPGGRASADDPEGERIAASVLNHAFALPWRSRGVGGTVQSRNGRLVAVKAAYRLRRVVGRGRFSANPDGPLGFLCGARLLVSYGYRDFDFSYGV